MNRKVFVIKIIFGSEMYVLIHNVYLGTDHKNPKKCVFKTEHIKKKPGRRVLKKQLNKISFIHYYKIINSKKQLNHL